MVDTLRAHDLKPCVPVVTFITFRVASFVSVQALETVTTRVPEDILQEIKRIEREEKADRAEVVRRLLADAIKRWRVRRALEMLRDGEASIRSAAKSASLSYVQMMEEMERAGISVDYRSSDLREDLERIVRSKSK